MSENSIRDRGPLAFRLPVVKNEADFDALPHLSDEEKEMGKKNLNRLAPSDGWYMLGNDPELQAFWAMVERESIALLYPDFQVIPFSPMNLVTLVVAKKANSVYQYGSLAAFTAAQVLPYGLPEEALLKLPFIDLPDSGLWEKEEVLAIKLAMGCVDLDIPKELFQEALETWGPQKTLRLISWIGVVFQWAMMIEALGMGYDHKKMSINTIPKAAIEKVTEDFQAIRPEMKKMWENLGDFGK